jgi:hypothetical protein
VLRCVVNRSMEARALSGCVDVRFELSREALGSYINDINHQRLDIRSRLALNLYFFLDSMTNDVDNKSSPL